MFRGNFHCCHRHLKDLRPLGFYPYLCILISSFLADRFIAAVVGSHCSITINNHVPGSSVLLPTLFMFINDLSTASCIDSYADDTTLHHSISFHSRPTLQDLHYSRRKAGELSFKEPQAAVKTIAFPAGSPDWGPAWSIWTCFVWEVNCAQIS